MWENVVVAECDFPWSAVTQTMATVSSEGCYCRMSTLTVLMVVTMNVATYGEESYIFTTISHYTVKQ